MAGVPNLNIIFKLLCQKSSLLVYWSSWPTRSLVGVIVPTIGADYANVAKNQSIPTSITYAESTIGTKIAVNASS